MEKIYEKKRGRPATVDKQDVFELLGRHMCEIFYPQSAVLVSKTDAIWTKLSQEFSSRVLPSTIYTYACEFKKDLGSHSDEADEADGSIESFNEETIQSSSIDESSIVFDDNIQLEIPMKKSDFMALTEVHKKRCTRNKSGYRVGVRLKPGQYADAIFDKIEAETCLPCAFKIITAHVSRHYDSGTIKAHCKCKSFLHVDINFDKYPNQVVYECTISVGSLKNCGKRLLRAIKRKEIAQLLQNKTTEKYRAEMANKNNWPEGKEPPSLYSAPVLRQAKCEENQRKYIDEDPMKAIGIMSHSGYESEIKAFWLKPFATIYWTNLQQQLYQEYCNQTGSYVSIDASGGFTKPLKKLYDRPSGPVFMYETSLSCSAGKFPTAQMLSESHDTNKISFFLMEQVRITGCIPKEVVTDMSRALMNAVTRAYTQFRSVEDYADYLFEMSHSDPLPDSYIRLDNAHFIHLYSGLFAKKPCELRKFYLGAIGQLIISRTKSAAKEIVKCILTLAISEKCGKLANGLKSPSQKAKEKLEALMTENEELDQIRKRVEDVEEDTESQVENFGRLFEEQLEKLEESSKLTENKWTAWGAAIKEDVCEELEQKKGTDISPYFLPDLGNYLLKHLALLPIWSCIRRDDFKYGRVPAATTSESGFKVWKTDVFPDLPYRVDHLIKESIEYLKGKMKMMKNEGKRVKRKQMNDRAAGPSNSIIETSQIETEDCSACQNNLPFPRTCAMPKCTTGIHHLEECSHPRYEHLDGEGFSEERICRTCYSKQAPFKVPKSKKKPTVFMNREHEVVEQLETDISTNESVSCQEKTKNDYQSEKTEIRRSARNKKYKESTFVTSVAIPAIPDSIDCSACKNKLQFSQICAMPMCTARIHNLPECSYSLYPDNNNSEGKRICHSCHSKRSHNEGAVRRKTRSAASLTSDDDANESDIASPTNQRKSSRRDNGINYLPPNKKRRTGDDASDICHGEEKTDGTMPKTTQKTVTAVRELENWMGLAEKSASKALYYGGRKEFLKDAIRVKGSHQINVLKNSNHPTSKSVRIKSKKICLANTSSFDSIAQILYVSICDNDNLKNKIVSHADDDFLKFVSKLCDTKPTQTTYKTRATILMKLSDFKSVDQANSMSSVEGNGELVNLVSSLTTNVSAVFATSTCSDEDCARATRTKTLGTIQVFDTQIESSNFCNLADVTSQFSSPCQEKHCSGERKNAIDVIGEILLVEVLNEDPNMMSKPVSLKNVPRRLLSPTDDGTELRLLGAIAYKGPSVITPKMAHYTAVCLRNHTWYEYDDSYPTRKTSLRGGAKIVPALFVYSAIL